jgi:transcriptional regulator
VYVPPDFEMTDRAWAIGVIERNPFALLITADSEYPRASHLPVVCRERSGELWLIGHVARANPHARSIAAGERATIVFQGAHAYVSASWYEEPYATVPTWNYVAVHVMGRLSECVAWEAVRALTATMEGASATAWDPERLEPGYRDKQLRGIVAFELRAEAISAKAKLSQNRTEADCLRVIERLRNSDDQTDRACADEMAAALSQRYSM